MKYLYFGHMFDRLTKEDLFLTSYSFLLLMDFLSKYNTFFRTVGENFHRHLSVFKKRFGNFCTHFPKKLRPSMEIFTDMEYYQSKNFSPFLLTNSGHVGGNFHRHFSVAVEKYDKLSSPIATTQWQVTINVKR